MGDVRADGERLRLLDRLSRQRSDALLRALEELPVAWWSHRRAAEWQQRRPEQHERADPVPTEQRREAADARSQRTGSDPAADVRDGWRPGDRRGVSAPSRAADAWLCRCRRSGARATEHVVAAARWPHGPFAGARAAAERSRARDGLGPDAVPHLQRPALPGDEGPVHHRSRLKDVGSTNGIDYKGMRIDNKRIDEGDVFHLCDYELRFTYRADG